MERLRVSFESEKIVDVTSFLCGKKRQGVCLEDVGHLMCWFICHTRAFQLSVRFWFISFFCSKVT